MSGTTWVSQYQNVHFAIFWIFWCKIKITQADALTIQMDCHRIQTNWCPHLYHLHHFYARCPSWHNPPNLSWLGTGTKYAGLHTQWINTVKNHFLLKADLPTFRRQQNVLSIVSYNKQCDYNVHNTTCADITLYTRQWSQWHSTIT